MSLYIKVMFVYLLTFLTGGLSYYLWSIDKHLWSVVVCIALTIPVCTYIQSYENRLKNSKEE